VPFVEKYDIEGLRAGIAKCKGQIAAMKAGAAGVIPDSYAHVNARQAAENQLQARYASLKKFEKEYLDAMIATSTWSAGEIIQRMEGQT
jgi:hypothetical protein